MQLVFRGHNENDEIIPTCKYQEIVDRLFLDLNSVILVTSSYFRNRNMSERERENKTKFKQIASLNFSIKGGRCGLNYSVIIIPNHYYNFMFYSCLNRNVPSRG